MGAVFALFAGFYYWIGKISGLEYPETLGQIHFWMTFIGVNLTLPRRIPDYPDAFAGWNAICSFGSYVSVVGILVFFAVVYFTLTSNQKCSNSPWTPQEETTTLEWMVQSPPAFHTFEELPAIKETV
jgi:cytochrome c oxidase subunit 1